MHRAAKVGIVPATRRDDAIPQRADVVGDGLPATEPGSVEIRKWIAGSGSAAATAGDRRSDPIASVRRLSRCARNSRQRSPFVRERVVWLSHIRRAGAVMYLPVGHRGERPLKRTVL